MADENMLPFLEGNNRNRVHKVMKTSSRPLEEYHRVWLRAHPLRNESWLRARMSDGFDVHHLDGNHSNNTSGNLVLIECTDHMMLHTGGARKMNRIRTHQFRLAKTFPAARTEGKVEREPVLPKKEALAAAKAGAFSPEDPRSNEAYNMCVDGMEWFEIGRSLSIGGTAAWFSAKGYATFARKEWPPVPRTWGDLEAA